MERERLRSTSGWDYQVPILVSITVFSTLLFTWKCLDILTGNDFMSLLNESNWKL